MPSALSGCVLATSAQVGKLSCITGSSEQKDEEVGVAMIAHTKARAASAWEGVLLDEVFLFAGGVEGAWSNDEGWMKCEGTKVNPCLNKDRRNTSRRTGDDRRERTGVVSRDGKVVRLQLAFNGLHGVLPPSLGLLKALRVLDLSGNRLKGTITPVCSLEAVEVVNLSSNFLSGSISDKIASLSNLQQLFLSENKLTGPIPDSLCSLLQLTVLCLDGNALSGGLPSGLGTLPKLTVLAVQGNVLSGHVPDLSSLTSLRTLELSWNKFSGRVPSFKALSALRVLNWQGPGQGHGLSGGLQPMLRSVDSGHLVQLVRLDISSHTLNGEIPDGLRALPNIEIIILRNNLLCGGLPSWLGDLAFLRHVDLADNLLEGSVPSSLAQLSRLETLLLHDNRLDGTLPRALATFLRSGQVTRFNFDGNKDVREDAVGEELDSPPPASGEDTELRAHVPEGLLAGKVTFSHDDRRPTQPDIQVSDGDTCPASKSAASAVSTGKSSEACAPPSTKVEELDPGERGRHDTEVLYY